MKKILFLMLSIILLGSINSVFAEETKAESAWETVSVMSQAAAEKTAESVNGT